MVHFSVGEASAVGERPPMRGASALMRRFKIFQEVGRTSLLGKTLLLHLKCGKVVVSAPKINTFGTFV